MKQLYEVTTENYKRYYVLADGYDESKRKVEEHIMDNDDREILTEDGDLNTRYRTDSVLEIKYLGAQLIT